MERELNSTQGRRAASRATKLRRRKARLNLLLGIAAAVVLLILVTPKEPIHRAFHAKFKLSSVGETVYQ